VYILALSRIQGIGVYTFSRLLKHFHDVAGIMGADQRSLQKVVRAEQAGSIFALRSNIFSDRYAAKLKANQVGYVTILDASFPPLLRQISDPPLVLYHYGDFRESDFCKCIAVVGTRKCTRYGQSVTEEIVTALCEVGFTIVSGLAFGMELVAHNAALACGGRTIAVISGRVDTPVPASNRSTYEKILLQGCGVSEASLDTILLPGMFASRNRIVSGLSLGTVVIEADQKSGALITAKLALDQGREVFSLPGSIYVSSSRGTNELIKKGEAKLIQGVGDILEEFGIVDDSQKICRLNNTTEEQKILDILLRGPLTLDDMIRISAERIEKLAQIVTQLELDGKITRIEDGRYVLKK